MITAKVWRSRAARGDSASGQIHLGHFVQEGELAILRLEGIDVDRSVGGLRSHILIQRIPRHALDIVVVFCDLPDRLAGGGIVDAGNIVHAAGDEEHAVG